MDQFRQSNCGPRHAQQSCTANEARNQAKRSCLEGLPLAMAYVPKQRWSTIYEAEKAICRGTAFPELDLPFGC